MPAAEENPRSGPTRRDAARDDGLQVLRRAAAMLDEIAADPGRLRLVDLEARLGLAKSTVRRLAVGLVDTGLAAVDDRGQYRLGDRLLRFTSADTTQLTAQFRPVIETVAQATGETVDLSVLRDRQMWFIDQIESTHRLRAVSAIGARFPLHDTANGKAAVAALADAEAAALLTRLPDDQAGTLRTAILDIRAAGIAFDRDEHTSGISAAGIAGHAAGGHIVAISVPAPTDRFRSENARIIAALQAARTTCGWAG